MIRDLTLAIDVGTGSVRAALLDADGTIARDRRRASRADRAAFGWSEQQPAQTGGTGRSPPIREVLGAVSECGRARIAAICACGQMHGTVLVDAEGGRRATRRRFGTTSAPPRRSTAFEAAHRSCRLPAPIAAIRQPRPGRASSSPGCATTTPTPIAAPPMC